MRTQLLIRIMTISVIVCLVITAGTIIFRTEEQYFYNKYNRQQVSDALSVKRNLTLHEYVNIMLSTENLKTISLQELADHRVLGCDDKSLQLRTKPAVLSWAKKVAGEAILKCVEYKDWYRMAMILLKIFDSLCAVQPNYTQWFERTPTNGVFGVESIRMMKDGNILPFHKLPPIPAWQPASSVDEMCRRFASTMFQPFRQHLMCKLQSTTEKKCDLLPIELFCQLGGVMLVEMYESK